MADRIAYDKRGALDEFVVTEGKLTVHLERMEGKCWFLAVYRGAEVVIHMFLSTARESVRPVINETTLMPDSNGG